MNKQANVNKQAKYNITLSLLTYNIENINFIYNNQLVSQTESVKYLGKYLYRRFTWKEHICIKETAWYKVQQNVLVNWT